jgi:glycosyltransferase involved in cell wall biosynthesis
MRIGVNARRLEGQRLGIGRFLEYLLKYWRGLLGPSDSVMLYLRAPLGDGDRWISEAYETKVLGPRLSGVAWETLVLGPRLNGLDVLFCPSYSVPLNYRGRSVVATHSLNEAEPDAHPGWYDWTYGWLYRVSARKADRVIVPSQTVSDDVQRFYHIPADKISIVREGADETFEPVVDEEVLRETRRTYLGEDRPYILFVGKFSQRRNIPLLLRAFADLKKRNDVPHSLLLMGVNILNLPLDELIAELGIADSVVITNRTFDSHLDIIPLFSAADLYTFPSAYEGASNTVVEAMSCGVPVVAARRAAIAEIVDDSGLLIDEITVEALSGAMERVITDRALWQELRDKGLERSRIFRWKFTAEQMFEILQSTAQAGR